MTCCPDLLILSLSDTKSNDSSQTIETDGHEYDSSSIKIVKLADNVSPFFSRDSNKDSLDSWNLLFRLHRALKLNIESSLCGRNYCRCDSVHFVATSLEILWMDSHNP